VAIGEGIRGVQTFFGKLFAIEAEVLADGRQCDFPGGSALLLHRSLQRLYALPGETVVHNCHDYPAAGHPPVESSTIAEQRAHNVHCSTATAADEFVARRAAEAA
jgi:hypothetical protein